MKKAYLVTFTTTARVVVDVPRDFDVDDCSLLVKEEAETYDTIIEKARENILENPENYIYGDNAVVGEDKGCPYGTFEMDF
ncbi:MAG: hypothetical protein J6Y37_15205 [Paludibacteraceae bacterium]|nr:hypothetical protein [Paludibacteraceae bacterium]